jgi:hypothetical protein
MWEAISAFHIYVACSLSELLRVAGKWLKPDGGNPRPSSKFQAPVQCHSTCNTANRRVQGSLFGAGRAAITSVKRPIPLEAHASREARPYS